MTVTTSVGKNVRSRGVVWWMGFADAWPAHRDDVDGLLHERAGAQPFDLELQRRAEAVALQGGEGLLARQARLAQMALDAALAAEGALLSRQLVEEGLVGEVGFAGLDGGVGEDWRKQTHVNRSSVSCRARIWRKEGAAKWNNDRGVYASFSLARATSLWSVGALNLSFRTS